MRNVRTMILLCAVTVSVGCSNPFTPAGHEGYIYESPRVYGKGGFKDVTSAAGS